MIVHYFESFDFFCCPLLLYSRRTILVYYYLLCPILSCPVLYCHVTSCPVLPCLVLFIYLFTYSFTYLFIYLFIYLFTYLFIYFHVCINYLFDFDRGQVDLRSHSAVGDNNAILSELGTLQIEFRYLAEKTKIINYEKKVMKPLQILQKINPDNGLYPIKINIHDGSFADTYITLGALGDILYNFFFFFLCFFLSFFLSLFLRLFA